MERLQQAATKCKLKKSAAVTFEDTVSMHPNPDIFWPRGQVFTHYDNRRSNYYILKMSATENVEKPKLSLCYNMASICNRFTIFPIDMCFQGSITLWISHN